MTSLLNSPVPPITNVSLNASAAKAAYLLAVHEISHGYAVAYVCVVLVCYTVGMSVLLTRHFRWAGSQPRLAVLYHAITSRTASLRQRRADPPPLAAPQVVVHEPEVSPGPSGHATAAPQLLALAAAPAVVDAASAGAARVFQETDF